MPDSEEMGREKRNQKSSLSCCNAHQTNLTLLIVVSLYKKRWAGL